MSATITTLPYSTEKRRGSFRRHWRRVFLIMVIASISTVVWLNRDELSLRARRMYWGYRCAHHVTPPGTVLAETDAKRAAALLAGNPDYVTPAATIPPGVKGSFQTLARAVYFPREWREFMRVEPRRNEFYPPILFWTPINFLGERTSPDGHRWIVVLAGDEANAYRLAREINSLVLPEPKLFETLSKNSHSWGYAFSGPYVKAELAPAVSDPRDASHLTMSYHIPNSSIPAGLTKDGLLDIWTLNGGTLNIQVRKSLNQP